MHRNHITAKDPLKSLLDRAARQLGVFTTEDAVASGLSRARLRTLVDRGVVQRRRPGLFVVVGAPDTHQRRAMEAVLAGPARSAISHTSAAHLHTGGVPPALVHVTVGPNDRIMLDGVVSHRSPLPPAHVARIGPIPVTTLARTAVDLASFGDLTTVVDFLDPLLASKRTSPERVLRTLDEIVRRPGRHGTRLLRHALAAWTEPIRPDSPAEARLLRRLAELGFDGYVTQFEVVVGGHRRRIDVAWPDDLVGLEYTGRGPHGPRRWSSDERRSAELASLGWRLREVDALDLMPAEAALWNWLRRHLRDAAA